MNFHYENQKLKQGYKFIIGCDEVGRGCLAGPVVAAAVALPRVESLKWKVESFKEIKDSKLLSPQKREELSVIIKENFLWSIAEVSSNVVDDINIHNASLLAMKKAVDILLVTFPGVILSPNASEGEESLNSKKRSFVAIAPQDDALSKVFVAVDGKFIVPGLKIAQQAVIDGDAKILSIAAASVIAKVYRDNLMRRLHQKYPIYNFAQHKGYATLHHRKMIIRNGLSPLHRQSFCQNLTI